MKKVIVGLSGGVDSSVSTLLLKEKKYNLEALFMRNWDSMLNNDFYGNKNEEYICPQEIDYMDAQKVAQHLGIKIGRVDFVKEYWDYVFEYFLEEYAKGRTPNPDILCNKFIKFDKFLKYAIKEHNADFIAMGHYAKINFNEKTNEFELQKPVDLNKDQTYFLSRLNQFQLSKTIFPLSELTKPEVRELAKNANLPNATKKDSTGICFIGERDFTKFLQNYIPNMPGDIIDIDTNKVVGKHIGAMYYTIGQRKGLNLGGSKKPYYVCKKDIEKKIIYVTDNEKSSLLNSLECEINEINWINTLSKYFENSLNFICTAKFRYRQEEHEIEVKLDSDQSTIAFIKSKLSIHFLTEGQEAVFYLNNICLGGGIINKIIK